MHGSNVFVGEPKRPGRFTGLFFTQPMRIQRRLDHYGGTGRRRNGSTGRSKQLCKSYYAQPVPVAQATLSFFEPSESSTIFVRTSLLTIGENARPG